MSNNYFSQKVVLKEEDLTSGPNIPLSPVQNAVIPANDFKTYDQEQIPGAPGKTPEKGLTSIIIPVYLNSYPIFHSTGHCVGSIREHTNNQITPYEIIMIINGKTGIELKNLQETKADKVIENPENLGFAKAVNQGIRCARGEYIAIVNNDVMVFDHWLDDLQDSLNYLDLAMATPMYGEPFARAVEAQLKRNATYGGQGTIETTFSDFRDFSCILTRKEMFDKIGIFNEEFHMYGEDIDLLRRMDKAGLKYASTKRVNTFHIIGGTSSGNSNTPEVMNESKEILKRIWGE